jgi:hypothetical protein
MYVVTSHLNARAQRKVKQLVWGILFFLLTIDIFLAKIHRSVDF